MRVAALYRGWEEPLASEPAGVLVHGEGRPLLGRKLKGKSQRELRDLGLVVEDTDGTSAVTDGKPTGRQVPDQSKGTRHGSGS